MNSVLKDLASILSKEFNVSEGILTDFCQQSVSLINSIKKQLADNNLKEAGILLHRLKGSAGNLRAKKIEKQAIEAEEIMRMMDIEKLGSLLQSIEGLLKGLMKKDREGEEHTAIIKK